MRMSAGPEIIENRHPPGNVGPSSCCTCNAGPQPGVHHALDCLWKAPDQFVHDSLWTEYLDNIFRGDLLLHDVAGPMQYVPLDGTNPTGESTIVNI